MLAAKVVGELLRPSLGPRGMDKMLVGSVGDVTVTKSGVTILSEANIEHPVAKMIVEASKSQDKEVGDGTTSVAILTSELLRKAEDLIRKKIHKSVITSGYFLAAESAVGALPSMAVKIDPEDKGALRKIAFTSLSTGLAESTSKLFSEIAVDAVSEAAEKRGGKFKVDTDDIQIVKKEGKSANETQLFRGVILDKEVVHPNMPKRLEDCKIALIDFALEIEKTEISAEIKIKTPEVLRKMREEEAKTLEDMVKKVAGSGANVVICQKGIDEDAQHLLSNMNVLAVRRVKRSDMEKLARATGGKIVSNAEEVRADALGKAGLVEERKVAEDKMVFVEKCANAKSLSILLRGETEKLLDEYERAMKSVLTTLASVFERNMVVAGGGAVEAELAKILRRRATRFSGGRQLAVLGFADALEELAIVLSENAGLNPMASLTSLRAAHKSPKGRYFGIDLRTGKPVDMLKRGFIEPLVVKERYIRAASEVANMILRIDDVVIASKPPPPPKQPEGY
ncbi:MAG: thermosome subunit [Candidatus Brockarchaeota archaeon]|nr:thermosome subunit [Candidatus Brockarchaeota archaeon]